MVGQPITLLLNGCTRTFYGLDKAVHACCKSVALCQPALPRSGSKPRGKRVCKFDF